MTTVAYFKNISSLDDLKAQYRALALANHPDMGGDAETMKAINS
jgi:curved DNA-binding protein CbpA